MKTSRKWYGYHHGRVKVLNFVWTWRIGIGKSPKVVQVVSHDKSLAKVNTSGAVTEGIKSWGPDCNTLREKDLTSWVGIFILGVDFRIAIKEKNMRKSAVLLGEKTWVGAYKSWKENSPEATLMHVIEKSALRYFYFLYNFQRQDFMISWKGTHHDTGNDDHHDTRDTTLCRNSNSECKLTRVIIHTTRKHQSQAVANSFRFENTLTMRVYLY